MKWLLHQTLRSNRGKLLHPGDCRLHNVNNGLWKSKLPLSKKEKQDNDLSPRLRPQLFQGYVEARELLCSCGLPESARRARPGAPCLSLGHTRVPSSPEGLRSWHPHLPSAGPASSRTPLPLPAP